MQPLPNAGEAAPKKKSALPYFVVAGVLVAAAAGAVVWVTRAPAHVEPTTPMVATPTKPPVVTPPSKPEVAAPVVEEVIVDSVPPGAKIFVDGVAVADTPEAVKVEQGKTKVVVIKKDGFVDQEQTIDPPIQQAAGQARAREEGGGAKGRQARKLPAPPPASIDPPQKAPPSSDADQDAAGDGGAAAAKKKAAQIRTRAGRRESAQEIERRIEPLLVD